MMKIANTYVIHTKQIFETIELIKRFCKFNNVKTEIIANKSNSDVNFKLTGREIDVLTVIELLKDSKLVPIKKTQESV